MKLFAAPTEIRNLRMADFTAEAELGALRMRATPEDSVLRIALAGHRMVLRRLGDFAELAA